MDGGYGGRDDSVGVGSCAGIGPISSTLNLASFTSLERSRAAGEATRGIAKKGCSVGLCAYALVNLTPPVSRQNKQGEAFQSDSSAMVRATYRVEKPCPCRGVIRRRVPDA